MLSISNPIKGGRGNYYVNLACEDYYQAQDTGKWAGKGAIAFGLSQQVSAESFRNLLDGFDPARMAPLVQNAGKESRQQGWDLTFSAPKSVSVLWALSEKPHQDVIQAAHEKAVEKALSFIETTVGLTRRGHGGVRKERAKLMFARFEHFASRALDPQIHTHAILINLCLRQDGTTGSIQSREVFGVKMKAGALYRDELAKELQAQLGVTVVNEKVGFHIAEVPRSLCETFSKRRRAILARLQKTNETGAVAAKAAVLRTRGKKQHVPLPELFRTWREVGAAFGFENPLRASPEQPDKAELEKPPAVSTGSREKQEDKGTKEEGGTKEERQKTWQSSWDYQKPFGGQGGWGGEYGFSKGPERPSFIRTEWKVIFPKAPAWSPVFGIKLPRLVVGFKKGKVWGTVRRRRSFLFADLIVQDRKLFPNAPRWNPASKWKLPVYRVQGKSPMKKWFPGFGKGARKGPNKKRPKQETKGSQQKRSEQTSKHQGTDHGR